MSKRNLALSRFKAAVKVISENLSGKNGPVARTDPFYHETELSELYRSFHEVDAYISGQRAAQDNLWRSRGSLRALAGRIWLSDQKSVLAIDWDNRSTTGAVNLETNSVKALRKYVELAEDSSATEEYAQALSDAMLEAEHERHENPSTDPHTVQYNKLRSDHLVCVLREAKQLLKVEPGVSSAARGTWEGYVSHCYSQLLEAAQECLGFYLPEPYPRPGLLRKILNDSFDLIHQFEDVDQGCKPPFSLDIAKGVSHILSVMRAKF